MTKSQKILKLCNEGIWGNDDVNLFDQNGKQGLEFKDEDYYNTFKELFNSSLVTFDDKKKMIIKK